jgi:hypothetical protein
MSVYQDSASDIILLAASKSALALTAADITVSAPTVNSDSGHTQNTKVRLTALAGSTLTRGTEVVYLNRLDLAIMANYPTEYTKLLTGAAGQSVLTMLTKIRDIKGITFLASDLVDNAVVADGSGNLTVVLQAAATSKGWTGTYTLACNPKPQLSTLFATDIINWS